MSTKRTVTNRKSVTSPAIEHERADILNILLDDAGKDAPPRHKKGTTSQQAKQSQVSKAAPVSKSVSPAAPTKPVQPAKRQSLTPAQQLEQQQILSILLDDAGKDWKPRNKVSANKNQPKPVANKTAAVRPSSAKPKTATQVVQPRKVFLTPAQQLEQQQILSILMDDAGKDWKPRNKSTTTSRLSSHTTTDQHNP
ncbi:hypothetical protein As57867_005495, partial [Aphanomyces stellatus]